MNLDYFLGIEKKYGLLEKEIDGFSFWIYTRVLIQWEIRDQLYGYTSSHPNADGTCVNRTKKRIEMLLNAFLHGHIPKKKQEVLVINFPRKVRIGKYYECIYTEELVKRFQSVWVLEPPYEQTHFKPTGLSNYSYLDGLEIKAQIFLYYNQIFRTAYLNQLRAEIYKQIQAPLKELENYYKVKIQYSKIIDYMVIEFLRYPVRKSYYSKVLDKVNPAVIVEVCSYDPARMVINELAKEREIPTVELQHGVTGRDHIAYNYYLGAKVSQFPDYFFAFSDFWKSDTAYPLEKEYVISVGYPYLERQKKQYAAVKRSQKKTILFLSQGIIGKQMADIAMYISSHLDSDKYRIIYKLHPNEYSAWRELYPQLVDSEMEIIGTSEKNIYQLFSEADMQVGFFSTAIYEGLIYNLDTYVLVVNGNLEMQPLIEAGYAMPFESQEELLDLILSGRRGKRPETTNFWNVNSIEQMTSELRNIIERKG